MSSQYSIVHLRVKAETEFGQVVHVSGSSFTMGNFSTAEVRTMDSFIHEEAVGLTLGLTMVCSRLTPPPTAPTHPPGGPARHKPRGVPVLAHEQALGGAPRHPPGLQVRRL